MNKFKGSGVALVTPFNPDKSIDFQSIKKLVQFHVENETDFLVIQGTTGESPTLSEKEKKEVLHTVLDTNNGKLPIVFGVGGNDTTLIGSKIQDIPEGVDGILSVSPYYNKPTQRGIYEHYKYISERTELPVILYNVPGRTSSNIATETTLRLAELKNIVAVKEASGNMEQIMDILANAPKDFSVLSGDDALTFPMMTMGATGVISVVANAFPRLFKKMVACLLKGEIEEAKAIHFKLIPITKMFFQEGNPAGVKVVLEKLNLLQGHLRLPLLPVSAELKFKIEEEYSRLL